jgi:hypothetical protein
MRQMLVKHANLPIPDLAIDYEIDVESRIVHINLGDHFDSVLLLDFVRNVLEQAGIRTIERDPHNDWNGTDSKGRYGIEVMVFGQIYRAQIIQLVSLNQDAKAEYTISLIKKRNVMVDSDNARTVLWRRPETDASNRAGNGIVELPSAFLEKLGWKEDDTVNVSLTDKKEIVLRHSHSSFSCAALSTPVIHDT